jgi:phosphoribosylformylglycinamidine synthase
VTDQYDRYVLGNTVLAQPADAGVVRVDEQSGRGVAVATDGTGRYCKLDPYAGALLALSEAYRNVAVTGAKPLAVTDCLNFGSPEDPDVMWQFAEATRGLADACLEMGVPVTGGNVSFYNQTGDVPINPTPVVGVLGVIDDVTRRTPMAPAEGQVLLLLGETRDELGGSEWAHVVHAHLGGLPPRPDLAAEMRLAGLLVAGSQDGVLGAAHDVSDGGLAQCLVEMALAGDCGVRVRLPDEDDPFVALFSESVARVVVAVAPDEVTSVERLAGEHGVTVTAIGAVSGDAVHAWCSPAESPPPRTSSAGEPSSTMRPCSRTSTRSAISTVDRRCAMISAVRSARIVRSARCTNRSLGMSSEDVASSRMSTAGSPRKARANATSWR